MGNRAVITTEDKNIGVYVHWNGGRESVETFLEYCKLKGYRCPEYDDYGWARLCQVIGNFFGGALSLGINKYEKLHNDNGDNGVYIIKDWNIVDREYQYYKDDKINSVKELEDNLIYLNNKQPESEKVSNEEIHEHAIKWGEKNLIKDRIQNKERER